jgi:hypothetical protein
MLPRIWSRALERMDALSLDDVEIAVRDDDGTLRELVMKSGFPPSADADLVTTLMRAGDTPAIAALPMGSPFRIGSTTPIASITWRRAGRRTVVPDIPLPP